MEQVYHDRREAGRVLGEYVRHAIDPTGAVVVAVPRGGVPVGFEVARALNAPLDIVAVRRLRPRDRPECVLGAVAAGGFETLNRRTVNEFGIGPFEIAAIADCEIADLERSEALYRDGRPPLDLHERVAVIVDDGIASGFTMRTAIAALRPLGPARIVVATPIATTAMCDALADESVAVVCPVQPDTLDQVGSWYRDFRQTRDEQVQECLTLIAQEYDLSSLAVLH